MLLHGDRIRFISYSPYRYRLVAEGMVQLFPGHGANLWLLRIYFAGGTKRIQQIALCGKADLQVYLSKKWVMFFLIPNGSLRAMARKNHRFFR